LPPANTPRRVATRRTTIQNHDQPQRSNPNPVDLTNPGQFFACCGLLEFADRLWPGAEGWFDSMDQFVVSTGGRATSTESLCMYVIGQQAITGIADAIKAALTVVAKDNIFETETVVRRRNDAEPVAPLSFDAGRVGTAQDIGYSPDKVGQAINCCIWTEFLTLIALQPFALKPDPNNFFTYLVSREPLPPCVAAVAASRFRRWSQVRLAFDLIDPLENAEQGSPFGCKSNPRWPPRRTTDGNFAERILNHFFEFLGRHPAFRQVLDNLLASDQ
jgi:hypothetical protein